MPIGSRRVGTAVGPPIGPRLIDPNVTGMVDPFGGGPPPGPVPPVKVDRARGIGTNQIAVPTTGAAVSLQEINPGRRTMTIRVTGAATAYIGSANVTSAIGYPVPKDEVHVIEGGSEVYACAVAGAPTAVAFIAEYD